MTLAERNATVESLRALVWSIVRLPENRSYEADDLYSVGIIAAIEAVDTHDPSRGIPLSAWVWHRVRGILGRYRKQTHKRQAILRTDGGQAQNWDDIPETTDPDLDLHQAAEENEVRRVLMAAVSTLSEREQRVLTLRYGLDGGGARLQRDVAEQMGCSVSIVRHLERHAIQRLRHPLLQEDLWAIIQDAE